MPLEDLIIFIKIIVPIFISQKQSKLTDGLIMETSKKTNDLFSNKELLPAITLPFLFIVLWSSGYIGGAIGLDYAEPFTMTLFRFGSAAAILTIVSLLMKAPWPKGKKFLHVGVVGVLIQAVQFGGLYSGMNLGVPAGVSALIVGTMPILTAIGAGFFLGETVTKKQWGGLLLGICGVALVVSEGLNFTDINPMGYFFVIIALLGITSGALYQKKFCQSMDLRSGGAIQLTIAAMIMWLLASNFETMTVQWSFGFIASTAWLALMNSIGAISLMYLLLRRGKASAVSSLFFLIPPTTAIMATLVLGDDFELVEMLGFTVAVSGVYLATHSKP
ncbi:DMT family transporter [Marinomonas shanghaiensis]|uniref:DMT family transporter n=1 Tax=Marinomonas shanghaiensis TaxID=2202418 RepID=UPI001E436228|nr:EamA family transporter [Marinomonas shanghaiensis]